MIAQMDTGKWILGCPNAKSPITERYDDLVFRRLVIIYSNKYLPRPAPLGERMVDLIHSTALAMINKRYPNTLYVVSVVALEIRETCWSGFTCRALQRYVHPSWTVKHDVQHVRICCNRQVRMTRQ